MPRNLHSHVQEVKWLVDYTRNGLIDSIWRGDEELSDMGLQMPSIVTVGRKWKKYQNKSFDRFILKQHMSFACF